MPRYRGVVRGNVVVLEEKANLPDGMPVLVEVRKANDHKVRSNQDPFLDVDAWAPLPSQDTPTDLARNHDHYLYGCEKNG
ncbi:MAG TPA: hypothetical protein GXX50_01750 [Firmicutes bacterium]|uniref:hypothetical protein n=1 Tax=Gelria sp. Kuro-4 TaxID=2796927 RepID=UPI0019C8C275|nr:hypothetical protein [Gelria sp. Kuro-4]MDK2927964.1 hypothetical protein [Bacillota bacterium]BCV25513.1 hypothetical protein kuro4_22860 [Gelria sp. Kuro-4]HHV56475.1 hypothetical protein [Bacillota bacterium]